MAEKHFLRVAFEGCGHGKLHDIYSSVTKAATLKGWNSVDLVVIGGDFQAVRNSYDMACMSVPMVYKKIGDFQEYYSGQRTAPYLTIFIGGNHEASNHLFELYYGGWVAPNIYYLGAANVIRCGPLRIAGLSGIWKGYDYNKPHFERLPYSVDDTKSAYHVRELDVRKLLQIRTQVDLGLSHDWPRSIELAGDSEKLFQRKPDFRADSETGRLGNLAAKYVLDRLRPALWFSAHLHCKYFASVEHGQYAPPLVRAAAPPQPTVRAADQITAETSSTRDARYPENVPVPAKDHETNNGALSDVHTLNAGVTPEPTASLMPQAERNRPLSREERETLHRPMLSAWNTFHQVATKQEAEEAARHKEEAVEFQRQVDAGLARKESQINYQLTWRKVKPDNGFRRDIIGTETFGETSTDVEMVKNEDEIEVDLDTTSEASENETSKEAEASTTVGSDAKYPGGLNVAELKQEEPFPGVPDSNQQNSGRVNEVLDEVRNKLPPSFRKPESKPEDTSPKEPPVFEQHLPDSIKNMQTTFLALDKCQPHREFIHLLEIKPISKGLSTDEECPFKLTYDKEWLAITRVFADDLVLGDRNAEVAPDKGDIRYKPDIRAAEEWVEENIVKQGKITVPENFSVTAPVYDPSVPVTTKTMPPEYTNPQTAAFCELLDIKNKFHLSDEERQARMDAGPPESSAPRYPYKNKRKFGHANTRGGRGGRWEQSRRGAWRGQV